MIVCTLVFYFISFAKENKKLSYISSTVAMKRILSQLIGFVLLTAVIYFVVRFDRNVCVPCPASKKVPIEAKVEKAVSNVPEPKSGRLHVAIFSGRWEFLRVLLSYIFRELRQNGGVVDRVLFVMIEYTNETLDKLHNFSAVANSIFNDEVFTFLYTRDSHIQVDKAHLHPFFVPFYYHMLKHLQRNPSDVYFKVDDDIVYLPPNVFSIMLKNKNSSECFIHFGNIVTNWRCNRHHEKIGVYDNEVNPKALKMDSGIWPNCGWKSAECAEMILRAFVHHYHNNNLGRYKSEGRILLNLLGDHGARVSINFIQLDLDLFDYKKMLETGPIVDDEEWLTVKYSGKEKRPNCIVGNALVVHFGYGPTGQKMLDIGLLKEFENIVLFELNGTLPKWFRKTVDFL